MNEQSIFLAALDIADLAERADYVNRTCASDAVLRRQVEHLLAAHERSGEFLDVPVLQQIAAGVAADQSSPADTSADLPAAKGEINLSFLQPSTKSGSLGRLGHYEIEEVIGRGGCGIVLKAFDEMLHRAVAIKVMAPELAATSPARKRFLREARAAAGIRHENVVNIHAVEEQPIPFLVMEYVAGQTLQQKLDQTGPLDVREVVQLGQQIASGLEAAHAMGLIHRDIKPGNILLEKGKDRIKITDFGLARAADDASLTQSGVIAGTPLYMSPEQAQGQVIDQRSDLFSFGSVLYVMCSGRPPFRATTMLAVLKRVAEDQPRPIHDIVPEVPEWLAALIAKLHAKKPDDRFASAQETASLLARCLSELQQKGRVESLGDVLPMIPKPAGAEQKQVVERPTPAPESRGPMPRRRWVAAAALLLALLAGLGLSEASGVTNLRGTVIRLFSPDGTLVVEVDDPGVSVSIDGEEMVITGTGAKEIRLKPGQYKVLASKDGKLVRQELVTVTRNGRQVVRVSHESAPVAPIARAASGPVTAAWLKEVASLPAAKQLQAVEAKLKELNPGSDGKFVVKGEIDGDVVTSLAVDSTHHFVLTDISPLRALTGLRKVHFLDMPLADLSPLKDLKLTAFTCCRVRISDLSPLKNMPLTEVWLQGTPVKDLTPLKDMPLVYLGCPQTQVSDLTPLEGMPLVRLDFNDTQVSDLTPLRGMRLVHLNCWGTQVSDLTPLKGMPLVELNCWNAPVTDAGLMAIQEMSSLRRLTMGGPKMTDAGLAHLKKLTDLEELSVDKLTDVGLVHLKGLLGLRRLRLANTEVTDAGLVQLAGLFRLRAVELQGTRLTDAGLEHLASLKNLAELNLSGTSVTDKGIAKLKAALPKCNIIR